MIIEKVVSWIVSILLVIYTPYMIYFNIVHFVYKWKCRKKKYDCFLNRCHESECKFAKHCQNYEYLYTEEDIQQLYKMIEDYQKRTE